MFSISRFKRILRLIRRPRAFLNFKKYFLLKNLNLSILPFYPTWLELEVSTKCNLNCPRCERQIVNKNTLNQETPIEIANKLRPIFPYINFVSLVSSLGEPFLNKNFWDIVALIKKYGVSVGYTTNGLLLDSKNIQKTIEKKVDIVVISLESTKKDIYEKIRPGSNLDTVINNIKNLIKAKKGNLEIRLGFTIQKNNIEELPMVVAFAKKTGLNMVYFTALIPHSEEMVNECLYVLDKKYIENIFEETKKKAANLGLKIRLPDITPKEKNNCRYIKNTLSIDYQGDVFCNSCCRFPQEQYFCVEKGEIKKCKIESPVNHLGNINEESILKIWNNENCKKIRKDPSSYPCQNCYFKYEIH